MKILTCNIRCFGAEDGDNSWPFRKDLCAEYIRAQRADVICFQEMWQQQFADLSAALPGYAHFATIDEAVGPHPKNAIFFRADAFTQVSAGGYWLSKTPHVAGSKSWDSAAPRLANWVRLVDRSTGVDFRVVNTHLDHRGQIAREGQAICLVEDARAYPADYPQILTGDLNCDTNNRAIAALKAGGWIDTYGAIHGAENPGHTFHAFEGPAYESKVGKMDWIFARGRTKTSAAEVLDQPVGGRFPSDHYFVSATVEIGVMKNEK